MWECEIWRNFVRIDIPGVPNVYDTFWSLISPKLQCMMENLKKKNRKTKLRIFFWYQTRPHLQHICTLIQAKWFSCKSHTTKHNLHLGAQVYKAIKTAAVLYTHKQFHTSVHLMFSSIRGKEQTLILLILITQHEKILRIFIWAFCCDILLRTGCIVQSLGIKKIIEHHRKRVRETPIVFSWTFAMPKECGCWNYYCGCVKYVQSSKKKPS